MLNKKKKVVLIIIVSILAILLIGICAIHGYLINVGTSEDFPPVIMPDGSIVDGNDSMNVARVLIDEKKENFNKYKDGFFKLLDVGMDQKYDNYSATIKQSMGVANIGDDNIGIFTEIDIDVQNNVAHGFFKSYISYYDKNIVFEEKYEFYRTYDGNNVTTYLNVNGQWLSTTNQPMFNHVAIDIESMIANQKQQDLDYFPCLHDSSSGTNYTAAFLTNSAVKTTKVGQSFYDIDPKADSIETIWLNTDTCEITMYAFMHRKLSSSLLNEINEEINDSFLNFLLDIWNADLHVGMFGILFDQWGEVVVDMPNDIETKAISVDNFSDVTLNLQQAILKEIENLQN